jgi:hypothetical protein
MVSFNDQQQDYWNTAEMDTSYIGGEKSNCNNLYDQQLHAYNAPLKGGKKTFKKRKYKGRKSCKRRKFVYKRK